MTHQSILGHQGLKSRTNWPRSVEETLFPEAVWSLSLYRPMTALAGLTIVKFMQPGSLGSWVALQPLASSSERLNMALVCCDSAGHGPARGNRESSDEPQMWVANLGSAMISIPFFFLMIALKDCGLSDQMLIQCRLASPQPTESCYAACCVTCVTRRRRVCP